MRLGVAEVKDFYSEKATHLNSLENTSIYVDCRRPRFWRWLRIMALFVAVLFLCQQVTWAQGGQPITQKLPTQSPTQSPIPTQSRAGLSLPYFGDRYSEDGTGLKDLSIPKDKAITKTSYINGSDEVIINIQDAHDSLSAQYSIVDILDTLVKEYDLSLVTLEGTEGYIDTSVFKTFPIEEIRNKTADYLMKEGELSAGEFFSIVGDKDIALYGIESNALYKKHLDSFKDAIDRKIENVDIVDSLIETLSKIEERIYPEEILSLNRISKSYREGTATFKEYWEKISAIAKKRPNITQSRAGLNLPYFGTEGKGSYPNLDRLARSIDIEKHIDFNKANKERDSLVDSLKITLSKDELELLILKSLQYKLKKISSYDFHSFLTGHITSPVITSSQIASSPNVASEAPRNDERYENLLKYTEYVSFYESIDLSRLFQEMESFEEEIRISLFTTNDQLTLNKLAKEALILKDLFSVSLTNGHLEYLLTNIDSFKPDNFISFIEKYRRQKTEDRKQIKEERIKELFNSINGAVDFYKLALERDRALVNNTLSRMRKNNENIAALVTGGFHTKGMTDLLKRQETSYIVLVPKFDPKAKKRPYVAILTKKTSPYKDILDTGRYKIATYSHFVVNNKIKFTQETRDQWIKKGVYKALYDAANEGHRLHRVKNIWLDAFEEFQKDVEGRYRDVTIEMDREELEGIIDKTIEELAGEERLGLQEKLRQDPINPEYLDRQKRLEALKGLGPKTKELRRRPKGQTDPSGASPVTSARPLTAKERAVGEYNNIQDRLRPNRQMWFRPNQRAGFMLYLLYVHGIVDGEDPQEINNRLRHYIMPIGNESRPLTLQNIEFEPETVIAIQRYELARLESGQERPEETQRRLNTLRAVWNAKPWYESQADEDAIMEILNDEEGVLRYGKIEFPVRYTSRGGLYLTRAVELRVLSRVSTQLRAELDERIAALQSAEDLGLRDFDARLREIEALADDLGVRGIRRSEDIEALRSRRAGILEDTIEEAQGMWREIQENVRRGHYENVEEFNAAISEIEESLRGIRQAMNASMRESVARMREEVLENEQRKLQREKEALRREIEEFDGTVVEFNAFRGGILEIIAQNDWPQEEERGFQTAFRDKHEGLQKEALSSLKDQRGALLKISNLENFQAAVCVFVRNLDAAEITAGQPLLEAIGARALELINNAVERECRRIDGLKSFSDLGPYRARMDRRMAYLCTTAQNLKDLLGVGLKIDPSWPDQRISSRFAHRRNGLCQHEVSNLRARIDDELQPANFNEANWQEFDTISEGIRESA
ncbi:MAG: hypothetical protein ISS34_07525, partial [Candidatus Omnitrophica bacterium]|nr:hypothetical protein [Candidatus Omnitrophota bacterium]